MLDDLNVLADAAQRYQTACLAAGMEWPELEAPEIAPADVARAEEVFDAALPEQVLWFWSQGWGEAVLPVLPGGGWVYDRRATGSRLDEVAFAVGQPFGWRQQLPLFRIDRIVYTFVLAESHHGEIWRYAIDVDAWDVLRAAPSLASLLDQWTRGIESGMLRYDDPPGGLELVTLGRPGPLAGFYQDAGLDLRAFPEWLVFEPELRDWQRECGVDLDALDPGAVLEEQGDAADHVARQLCLGWQ